MITYGKEEDGLTPVYLENRHVGTIFHKTSGYIYRPKNSKLVGASYATIAQLKEVLEEE